MANKHMKSCSASLVIRKMQIKLTMRYHDTLSRIANRKGANHSVDLQGYGERGCFAHYWWEIRMLQTLWATA